MSSGRNTVMGYFAIIGGVLLIGLILFAPWPVWTSLMLAVAVMTAVVLLVKLARRQSRLSPLPEPTFAYTPTPPMDRREGRITHVLLPSCREDYYFMFSAMVLWSPMRTLMDESVVNMSALAVDSILERAREITEQREPDHASLVRHELGGALGKMQTDATGYLQVMAETVELVLPDHDQQRLDKLSAVRKEKALWEHERKYEQSKREYLGKDVLKDPGSAVVWWLAKNDDQVEKTVQDIGLLAQLSSAANNTDIPESVQRLVAGFASTYAPEPPYLDLNGSNTSQPSENGKSATDHFDAFMRAMDIAEGHSERGLFARRVAEVVAKHGRHEVADEIVRRFDTPDDPDYVEEEDHGD